MDHLIHSSRAAAPNRPARRTLALLSLFATMTFGAGGISAQEQWHTPPGEAVVVTNGTVAGILVVPPAAAGPLLGAVVVLPDASGYDPRGTPYTNQFLGAAMAVLEVQEGEGDADLLAAVHTALGATPRTRGLPVGVLGFGTGALSAMRIGEGVAARALLYPGCQSLGPAEGSVAAPVLLLHGTDDAVNSPESCSAARSRLTQAGMTVRQIIYPQAGYAWDLPIYGLEQRILLPAADGRGKIVAAPWPELTTISASQVAGFFSGAFAGAR